MKNKIVLGIAGSAIMASLLISATAFAATPTPGHWGAGRGQMPGVFGVVSAVSGDTLTVTSKGFGQNATATSYTVDATNATVTKNGASSSLSDIATGDTVVVQGTVSGTSVTATAIRDGVMGGMGMRPGVFGTVASISGTTLTVTSTMGPNGASATTYTVDASNATVTKSGTTSSLSDIAVGDTVVVQGTVSGTSVTATAIRDGVMQGQKPQTPVISGNGQPVVGGSVTAVTGTTLTIATAKGDVTYTVDASNATVEKGNTTSSVSSVMVGDNVVVQGNVSGTSVTASSIIDQGAPRTPSSGSTSATGARGFVGGFMGAVGGLFQHLFGFF